MDPIEPTIAMEITASTSAPLSPGVGIDIFSLFSGLFGGSESTASFFSASGFVDFFGTIWNVYAIIAYIASIIMLGLYAYASTLRWHMFAVTAQDCLDMQAHYDAHYRGEGRASPLTDINNHIASSNPNDWKLAIIEADIILDNTLKQRGYAGNSLGERLKSIGSGQLSSLQDAWEAHKVRNRIAHEGSDFVLTQRIAEETIMRYKRVFLEFNIT